MPNISEFHGYFIPKSCSETGQKPWFWTPLGFWTPHTLYPYLIPRARVVRFSKIGNFWPILEIWPKKVPNIVDHIFDFFRGKNENKLKKTVGYAFSKSGLPDAKSFKNVFVFFTLFFGFEKGKQMHILFFQNVLFGTWEIPFFGPENHVFSGFSMGRNSDLIIPRYLIFRFIFFQKSCFLLSFFTI